MSIVPGPCPPAGCSPPAEIACIGTKKVYDFCIQTITTQVCFAIPTEQEIGRAAPITCEIFGNKCTLRSRRQLPPVPGLNLAGFARLAFDVCFQLQIAIRLKNGFDVTVVTERCIKREAAIYAPVGTTVVCNVIQQTCDPCRFSRIVDNVPTEVCCDIALCLEIQPSARVKLLVPSYGFCIPSECVEFGGLPCPPGPLFPPQLGSPPIVRPTLASSDVPVKEFSPG